MATAKYERYGVPIPPEDPNQDVMTVQETAYVLQCSVSWLRRFLANRPDLHGRNGGPRKRITTNREQRAAIHQARSGGDPRTGRTVPRQRRRTAKPALATP